MTSLATQPGTTQRATATPALPERVWGLTPLAAHDRWWASKGVQVVRPGSTVAARGPRLYLLLERGEGLSCSLAAPLKRMQWLKARAMRLRVVQPGPEAYVERVETDADGAFRAVRRRYWASTQQARRAALTPDPQLAALWRDSEDPVAAWRKIRGLAGREQTCAARVQGRVYRLEKPEQAQACLEELLRRWTHIGPMVQGVFELEPGVWAHLEARIGQGARFAAPVWIGAGANVRPGETVVGPCVLADAERAAVSPGKVDWAETMRRSRTRRGGPTLAWRASKRAFDIAFSLAALAVTLPLYPFIILAICLEDGWPPFFAHTRQTVGGREFPCIKFRTMCKDAEAMKRTLAQANAADGPQFFIRDDPRLLRVGRLLRRTQLDEAPQFLNVLLGHMSVVGPRPSPDSENQCCPTWREARLSVRPGVTGLWQIKRTRAPQTDFQEWIRYDLEYVQRQSWRLDLWIILQTVRKVLRG